MSKQTGGACRLSQQSATAQQPALAVQSSTLFFSPTCTERRFCFSSISFQRTPNLLVFCTLACGMFSSLCTKACDHTLLVSVCVRMYACMCACVRVFFITILFFVCNHRSVGSFFDFQPKAGAYEANPPFVRDVILKMANHMDTLLEVPYNMPLLFRLLRLMLLSYFLFSTHGLYSHHIFFKRIYDTVYPMFLNVSRGAVDPPHRRRRLLFFSL